MPAAQYGSPAVTPFNYLGPLSRQIPNYNNGDPGTQSGQPGFLQNFGSAVARSQGSGGGIGGLMSALSPSFSAAYQANGGGSGSGLGNLIAGIQAMRGNGAATTASPSGSAGSANPLGSALGAAGSGIGKAASGIGSGIAGLATHL